MGGPQPRPEPSRSASGSRETRLTCVFARIPPRRRSPVRVWPARTSSRRTGVVLSETTHLDLMTSTTPLPRRRPRTAVRVLVLLCAVGGLLGTIPVSTASAAPIDDLRAQAAGIEQQMNDVGHQLGVSVRADQGQAVRDRPGEADHRRLAGGHRRRRRPRSRASPTSCTSGPPACTARSGNTGVTEFDTNIKASRVAAQVRRRDVAEGRPAPQQVGAREGRPRRASETRPRRCAPTSSRSRTCSRTSRPSSSRSRTQLTKLQNSVKGEIADLVAQEQAKRRADEAARTAALVVAAPTTAVVHRRTDVRHVEDPARRAVPPVRSSRTRRHSSASRTATPASAPTASTARGSR